MGHTEKLPGREQRRDAFDVAFSFNWIGAAATADIRYSTVIEPPELPWPLRFYFVRAQEDDGALIWVCVGFEVGAAIPREGFAGSDTDKYELSAQRIALIWESFNLYKRMAEDLLIPAPPNRERAVQTRTAMGRRRRGRLDDVYLAVLAAEHRDRAGEPGLEYAMAAERGIERSTLYRQLKKAEQRGL